MSSGGKFLNVVKEIFIRKFSTKPGFKQTSGSRENHLQVRSGGNKQSVVKKVVGQ